MRARLWLKPQRARSLLFGSRGSRQPPTEDAAYAAATWVTSHLYPPDICAFLEDRTLRIADPDRLHAREARVRLNRDRVTALLELLNQGRSPAPFKARSLCRHCW